MSTTWNPAWNSETVEFIKIWAALSLLWCFSPEDQKASIPSGPSLSLSPAVRPLNQNFLLLPFFHLLFFLSVCRRSYLLMLDETRVSSPTSQNLSVWGNCHSLVHMELIQANTAPMRFTFFLSFLSSELLTKTWPWESWQWKNISIKFG